jgi:hypothetical protein
MLALPARSCMHTVHNQKKLKAPYIRKKAHNAEQAASAASYFI